MSELKVGTELISKGDGERAVVISTDINPSVLTADGYVAKFVNAEVILKHYTPTDYIYTEVTALLNHMKVMKHIKEEA